MISSSDIVLFVYYILAGRAALSKTRNQTVTFRCPTWVKNWLARFEVSKFSMGSSEVSIGGGEGGVN